MSVLQEVKTEAVVAPPRLVIYGAPKVGKSTLVATMPSPIVADIENGCTNIEVPKIQNIKSLDKFGSIVSDLLTQPHDYKTFAIDSADWLESLVQAKVCQEQGNKTGIEDIGYGKGYTYTAEMFSKILCALDRLREERGMMIAFLCHNQVKPFHDPLNDTYDRHTLKLHNKIEALLTEWSDAILFATKKIYTVQRDAGGFNQKEVKATGGSERVLVCADTPTALAGNRYGMPQQIPMEWAEIQKYITKEK